MGTVVNNPDGCDLVPQPSLLVVDDEPNSLVPMDRILSKEGYRVTTARGSIQALTYINCVKFSVAVLDIRIYPMSGIEVLRKLKISSPSTYVVMVTGYPTEESYTECIKLGADCYLTKPLDYAELKAALRLGLTTPRGAQPLISRSS